MRGMLRIFVVGMSIAAVAGAARAAESYKLRVTEGIESLAKKDRPADVSRLTGQPLMIVTAVEGTHWRWMLNGCPPKAKNCEWRVNARGASGGSNDAAVPSGWDLGLTRLSATSFQVRCLRDSCALRQGNREDHIRVSTLKRGESIKLKTGETIQASFK